MSSQPPVPIVAPWQSSYRQSPVQVVEGTRVNTFGPPAHVQYQWVIPDGQWWRFLSFAGPFSTSATVANRTVTLQLVDVDAIYTANVGGVILTSAPPAAQIASVAANYLFVPGGTAWSQTAVAGAAFYAAPFPDLVWPGTLKYVVDFANTQTGDTNANPWYATVESYIEDYTAQGQPVLVPTPTFI